MKINYKINKLINYIKKYSITITVSSFLVLWFYILQVFLVDINVLTERMFYSTGENIIKNLIAQLSHSDNKHLNSNVASITIIGFILETIYNNKKKIIYYIIINTILLSIGLYIMTYINHINSFVGYSCVIYSLIPVTTLLIYEHIQKSKETKYILIFIFILIFITSSIIEFYFLYLDILIYTEINILNPQVSSIGHLFGFIIGILSIILEEKILKVTK